MLVQPYLNYDGRCEEALNFYREAIGAEILMQVRFKEGPEPGMITPGLEDKIMHSSFKVGESVLMASDSYCQGQPKFQGISLALQTADVAEAEKHFAALGNGGQVQMPLMKTFFSPAFGLVTDKFGVSWMVVVQQ